VTTPSSNQFTRRFAHRHRHLDRALSRVGTGRRVVKEHHDPVAGELDERALELTDERSQRAMVLAQKFEMKGLPISSQCLPTSNSPIGNTCTDGVATGDLRGAVGVQVLAFINPNLLHNRHHWVTESGDTIFFADANLTSFTTSDPNRALFDYVNGIDITGGTGRFEDAKGTIFAFGAGDFNLRQITLRYAGTVCFPTVNPP